MDLFQHNAVLPFLMMNEWMMSPLALLHLLCGSLLICCIFLLNVLIDVLLYFWTLQSREQRVTLVFSKNNEETEAFVRFNSMFFLFNPQWRRWFVLSRCLGIVRCDEVHTYALLRDEGDSFFSRCTKFDPCRSGKEYCMPLNVPYTSFVPFLLSHVI